MKHLRWFGLCLAIVFVFSVAFSADVDARSSRKDSIGSVDNKKSDRISKKRAQKEATSNKRSKKVAANKKLVKETQKKESAKNSRIAKNSKKTRRLDKKSKNAAQEKQTAERDVWLKRARESEILLSGKASWYGKDFHNKDTASGVKYDMHTFTAAHRTLPLGTVVKVTDQQNGKSVMVCVTDRGPYVHGRIIDISYAAAKQLDLKDRGVGKVKLEVVSDEKGAPLKSDHAYYIKYGSRHNQNKVGPFNAFADAAAMHEALSQAHPEAQVILDKSSR